MNTFATDSPGGNGDLYALGSRYAELAATLVAGGVPPRAALRRVAADQGRGVEAVRAAVRFKDAVDQVVANVGPAARMLILAGGRHLPPKLVVRISRTHPERQRFAMAQVARGRHSFAKPPAGVVPPFDTLGYGEVRSRIARTAGSLDWVRRGLAATATGDWPPDAKLGLMIGHLAEVRTFSTKTLVLQQQEFDAFMLGMPSLVM